MRRTDAHPTPREWGFHARRYKREVRAGDEAPQLTAREIYTSGLPFI
jgi:hypothetical protein